ncbi:hypothetical protein Q4E93_15355 [Flavitalea sp. BT771]|uniref:ArnT family glycosyltransferase n=1 Tax=Flavitalea sp. BT771 TaxID=3063329 RepID=UPI0026E3AFEC|nr:hypothetical protein [Flavitalea sp. BT771]MDO6431982.1 hypothetical protein [Flavitalea sp. BT771]MDV6220891.1 hypothetical protein [Flavitalea sp. BT771]
MLDKLSRPLSKNWQVLLFFSLAGLLLYLPVLGNVFLTDDYAALYRVSVRKEILHKGFFRPLIDVTFWFNYLFSGLHPRGYYLFNLALHVATSYMVFKVALDMRFFSDERREALAWTAGWLFLFYPFHNESIVWLSGRLSSIAALCALVAIHYSYRSRPPWNWILPGLAMLTGLLAYESIVMLPLMIFLLTWQKRGERRAFLRTVYGWVGVVVLYLLIRYFSVGTLLSRHKSEAIVTGGWHAGVVRLIKSAGRCFLPPIEATGISIIAFLIVCIAVAAVHILLWRRRRTDEPFLHQYVRTGGVLALSMVPLVSFGVSTRTSEGDRLLYFPSCFLCIMVSALLFVFVREQRRRLLLTGVMIAGSIFFLERNNQLWVTASKASSSVTEVIKGAGGRNVILINMPDEMEGVPVFRNNFANYLMVNKADTGKVYVNNYLLRLDYLPVKGNIPVTEKAEGSFIYPCTLIRSDSGGHYIVENLRNGAKKVFSGDSTVVCYWDKSQLKSLILK